MNREAAALGVPVYTTYGGRLGGVDEALIREGRLRPLTDPRALELVKRDGRAERVSGATQRYARAAAVRAGLNPEGRSGPAPTPSPAWSWRRPVGTGSSDDIPGDRRGGS